jgi:protein-disulfide isomerase
MQEGRLTKRERRALAKEAKRRQRERQITYNRLKKAFVATFGVFVLAFFGVRFWRWLKTPTPEVAGEAVEVSDADWVKGNRQAAVTLVEYSDFACPACVTYYLLVKQLNEEFTDNLLVVYRHFPLVSIHKNAILAAKAVEAAGIQGKFWEMHDKLFDNQDEWVEEGNPEGKFVDYASQLELDEEKFVKDIESKEVEDEVNKDLFSANSLGLNSTPSFLLNGKKVQPGSFEEFKSLVENEIKNSSE